MPYFPQYQNADLVEYANYRQITQGTHVAAGAQAITAASGDVINNVVASGDASTYTITLPQVAHGGPVMVKVTGVMGQASNSVVIIPTVADTVAGCLIDGFGSVSLVYPNSSLVLASDGTQWWIISRSHNTTSTW